MEKYDVVIVGAGPGGGQLARDLSKKGYKVIVIEKAMELGEPIYSTAVTPAETIHEFDLPKEIAGRWGNSVLLAGPTERLEIKFDRVVGYVLRFKELKQFLIKDAIKNGAETMVGTKVTHPIIKGGRVIGVQFKGINGPGEIYGKIIVDASGPSGVLASQLGLRKTKEKRLSVGVEFLMENLDLESNGRRAEIYMGNSIIPSGYIWLAATKKDEARVGVGWITDFLRKKSNYKTLPYYLHNFIKTNPQTNIGSIIEIHTGIIYPNGGIRKQVRDGFLVIGEAACQTSPIAGEGIRACMWSGRFAAEVISEALTKKDYSSKFLSKYEKKWKGYVRNRWKLGRICQKLMANRSDKEIDKSIRILRKVDKEVFLRFLRSDFSRKDLLKLFPKLIHLF